MEPLELSLAEIHKFMIQNNCRVTNHGLVKHFKKFLKNPATESEARKQFKTYVNILATVVSDNNQKYLLLREKYLFDCPSEDIVNRVAQTPSTPSSPGNFSITSDSFSSSPLLRQPPPYKPPPKVTQFKDVPQQNYRNCVNEFQAAVRHIDPNRMPISDELQQQLEQLESSENNYSEYIPSQPMIPPSLPPRKRSSIDSHNFPASVFESQLPATEDNKENFTAIETKETNNNAENQISVKEATRKFNRMASEEEAKIISPQSKKKPEKTTIESKSDEPAEVTISHPKGKEWLVSSAKANYQELAKLASDYPELVRLQDPTTYTALHWAAKHGNEDVCKLIAGTYKANVNARTNGGYTPLHLAMQFGRNNIFDLLCNVYKANRDISDWSGKKPLDYAKQRTSVSASTYSKIKARRKHLEKDSGFLRIGSLNVRVKKTTEAFSNFLGVGSGNSSSNHHQHQQMSQQYGGIQEHPTASRRTISGNLTQPGINKFNPEKMHKSWGSVDNIQKTKELMPPPSSKNFSIKKRKSKRSNSNSIPHSSGPLYDPSGSSSMPTTPNQIRAPVSISGMPDDGKDTDSDTACGFDSNWNKTPTYF